jgi:hypothetical protein
LKFFAIADLQSIFVTFALSESARVSVCVGDLSAGQYDILPA